MVTIDALDSKGMYRVTVTEPWAAGGGEVIVDQFEFRVDPNGPTAQEQAQALLAARVETPEDPGRAAWSAALARLRRIQGFIALGVIPDNHPKVVELRQTVFNGLANYGGL